MSAPKKSPRPKARPTKKSNMKDAIDKAVREALNDDLPPGVDYYGEDGKLRSPERDYMNGGMVRRGYRSGGKVQARGCGAAQTSGFGGGDTY